MRGGHHWYLAGILAVSVALSVGYNVTFPLWEAPDEPAHVEMVRYIQEHRALPTERPQEPAPTPASPPGLEFSQVPLYYILLASLLSPVPLPPHADWHRNPYATWPDHPYRHTVALHRVDERWPFRGLTLFLHLGRLISTALCLVALLGTYILVRGVTRQEHVALFATAWLAWNPGFLLASARINNDAAVMAASAVVLIRCASLLTGQARATTAGVALLSVSLSAALLSKLHAAVLLPLAFVAAVMARGPNGVAPPWRRRVALGLATLAMPITLLGAWWFGYGRRFGGWVPEQIGLGVANIRSVALGMDWARLPEALWTLHATWWGQTGYATTLTWPPVVYLLLGVPAAGLFVVGLLSLGKPGAWASKRVPAAVLLMLASATPLVYAATVRQLVPWVNLDVHARFLLPVAPVFALVVAVGWAHAPLGSLRRALALAYLGSVLSVAVAAPLALFRSVDVPTVPARLALDETEWTRPALAAFASGVDLVEVKGLPPTLEPGAALEMRLLWRVTSPPPEEFTVFAHLVDRSGTRWSGHDAVPFQELFPPTLWQRGEFVEEVRQVGVPQELPPGIYTLRIGQYRLQGGRVGAIPAVTSGGHASAVEVQTWVVLPGTGGFAEAQPINARFGDRLILRGYRLERGPSAVHATLYWEAERSIEETLVVSVQALDEAGRLIAQHDGEPVDGRLPTWSWHPNVVVRDDHTVAVPSAGEAKRVVVVVYERSTLRRLPVTDGRATLPDALALEK